jgi:transposase
MRRYELSDTEWSLIAHVFPPGGGRGKPWSDHRTVLNGICFRFRAGVAWRDVPERYGPWQTLYGRFRRWAREGLFLRIARLLQLRLDERGMIDRKLWCVDGAHVRASRAAAGARKKRPTATSRPTTPSAGAGADSGRRSTSSPAATASRSAPSSRRGGGTSRRNSRP